MKIALRWKNVMSEQIYARMVRAYLARHNYRVLIKCHFRFLLEGVHSLYLSDEEMHSSPAHSNATSFTE